MFKKIFLTFVLTVIISSCFGDKTEDITGGTTLELYDSKEFSIFIPTIWAVLKEDDKVLPKPSNGDIVLAVNSKTETNGFLNNLVILKEKLNANISSIEYSKLSNLGTKNSYYQYELIEEKDLKYNDNKDSTTIYSFNARYNENTPMLTFLQTAIVCNENIGFLLTIGLSKGTNNLSKYENIIKTFKCKK